MSEPEPIAVVGMACRFPGAPDAASFWDNVLRDVYSITRMPPSRFHRERYYDPELGAYGKTYCELGGLIEDHPFDARGVHLPPKVLESTDVAHLWALEVARATFADAGLELDQLAKREIGAIIGHARGSMMTADMAFATATEGMLVALDGYTKLSPEKLARVKKRTIERIHARYPRRTEDGGIGSMASGLTGLIANVLGLRGRHMVVDAACASSFAALELGVRALRRGKLDLALVGGASYSQELSVIMFAQSRALSPDGTFPFDRRANGFISSDGIGLVLLERLSDAIKNGHRVRALIRGVGGSCDGKGRALWAPRKEGQVLAIRRAWESSGLDPATIGLIEAHATSTPIGDLTEIEALDEFFGPRSTRLPIGSVKGNIGHCREAAGAAGLIKAILALEHATIPPTGNFREPSLEIPWAKVALEVSTTARPWNADQPRRAGVDAFGIGGLNHHVIVEEAPPPGRVFAVSSKPLAPQPVDIAIVGIGGRFPGAKDARAFWKNLEEKRDALVDVPRARWRKEIYHQPGDRAPYRTYAKRGAFVTDFEADWKRYKVPPKLVERNDPLQFMLLESAIEALDDAKIDVAAIDRRRAAVLVGSVFGSDYALELSLAIRSAELAEDVIVAMAEEGVSGELSEVTAALRAPLPSINEDSSGSFSSSTLASRTSKTLDLMGPACAIDAACASSLASLEAACEMLRERDIDLVVYGGGDRAMRVQRYEAYCQFYALSRSDREKPFDADADGFLPGEGAAVCVLMRLEEAIARGMRVYAVVKGIGAAADGERKGLHRPSARALGRAMGTAIAESGLKPEAIGFVECHGAGTPVGDATEVEAIRSAYRIAERAEPLAIGSVKGNVGHAQGAAGVMSVVKTAMAIERGSLPATPGFERAHPSHELGAVIRVNRELEDYPVTREGIRAAGVSSMGIAGINYHAVLAAPAGVRANGAAHVGNGAAHRVTLAEGGEARELLQAPGFGEFWERTQPSIATLVEELWVARKRGEVTVSDSSESQVIVEEAAVVPRARVSRAEVQAFIVGALCAETGYPAELIDVNADLEADLGIDTVKQAQVLGKVRDKFEIRTDEKLSLRDFPTITKVLDYVDKELDRVGSRVAKKSIVPMLDLTGAKPAPVASASLATNATPAPIAVPVKTVPAAGATLAAQATPTARATLTPHATPAQSAAFAAHAPEPSAKLAAPTSAPSAESRAAFAAHATHAAAHPSEAAARAPTISDVTAPTRIAPATATALDREPSSSTPVVFLHLHGTARELGEQHGEALRDQIREVIDRYESFLGERGQEALALRTAIPHIVSFFEPASIEELEGIARAAGVPFKHLLAYNLDAALFPAYVAGCTQAVRLAWTNQGKMIHAVNEDSPLLLHLGGFYPRTVQIRRRTDGPHPHRRTVLFSVAGQSAGPNALSDTGLTITSTTLLDGSARAGLPAGAPHPQLVKKIVEEANTVPDAIALARAFPRAGRWSLLVSDADRDEAAYLEYDDATILREEYVTRSICTTNHAISGPAPSCAAPEHSVHRENRARALLDASAPLTVERAKEILRDREDLGRGRTVQHATMNTVRRVDNVMSLIVEPEARRFHVTDRVVSGSAQDPTQFVSLGYGASSIATRSHLYKNPSALPHPDPA